MGYDPIDLRPATVEELAAQDRKKAPRPRHRRSTRRPVVVILVTLALLVGGAGAWALAGNSQTSPELVQPYGPDAPFGVGYVDGFGEHSPKPTTRPSNRKPKPVQSSAAAASATPSRLDGLVTLESSRVSAVQWSIAFDGKFETYIWVHNDGPAPVNWEVRVQLPAGAKLTGSTAVNRTFVDVTWVFTPTKGSLGSGLVYLFSLSGTTSSSRFSLSSCTVNGSPCEPFH